MAWVSLDGIAGWAVGLVGCIKLRTRNQNCSRLFVLRKCPLKWESVASGSIWYYKQPDTKRPDGSCFSTGSCLGRHIPFSGEIQMLRIGAQ